MKTLTAVPPVQELLDNLTLTLQVYLMLPMDAFNWLSQQLCVLPVILHMIIFKLFSPNAPSASKFKDIKNPLEFF